MAGIGSFAAGLSQGYMNTYSTLSDIERRKQESDRAERLAKMQETKFQQEQDDRRALSDASQQTYGRVGKAALTGDLQKDTGIGAQQAQALNVNSGDAAFDAADRAQLADTLRGNAQRQGAAVPELPTYTREQAAKDYSDRLYTIDPLKGQQAEAGALALKKGGLEVKALERDADFNARFDKVMQGVYQSSAARMQEIQTTAEAGGMKGLVDKFGPELKKALGADVQLVGNNIVVKVKGQKPQTISSLSQAVQALQGAAQLEFGQQLEQRMLSDGLFKSPQELVKFFQDRREADRKDRDTDSAIALRDAQGAEARARAGAQAAYARSLGERSGNWAVVGVDADGKPVSYDRNTGRFAREDGKPIQDTALFRKVTGERATPAISPEREKKAYEALNKALEFGKPELVDAAKAQYPDVFGEDPLVKAFKEAQAKKAPPGTAPTVPPAAAAAPAAPRTLSDKLVQAIQLDARSGNQNNFNTLAAQVERELPAVQNQALVLAQALPKAKNATEQANIRAKLEEVGQDAQIMQSILDQRRAALGY